MHADICTLSQFFNLFSIICHLPPFSLPSIVSLTNSRIFIENYIALFLIYLQFSVIFVYPRGSPIQSRRSILTKLVVLHLLPYLLSFLHVTTAIAISRSLFMQSLAIRFRHLNRYEPFRFLFIHNMPSNHTSSNGLLMGCGIALEWTFGFRLGGWNDVVA